MEVIMEGMQTWGWVINYQFKEKKEKSGTTKDTSFYNTFFMVLPVYNKLSKSLENASKPYFVSRNVNTSFLLAILS
jgi:hypothetical protein